MIRETYIDPKAANPPNFTIADELKKADKRTKKRKIENEEAKEARREAERRNNEKKKNRRTENMLYNQNPIKKICKQQEHITI